MEKTLEEGSKMQSKASAPTDGLWTKQNKAKVTATKWHKVRQIPANGSVRKTTFNIMRKIDLFEVTALG